MKNGHQKKRLPRLYIGNLPYSMTGDALVQEFTSRGFAVGSPHIVIDKESGQSKGFAFVEMKSDNEDHVADVISAMNGSVVGGRTVKVDRAHERSR